MDIQHSFSPINHIRVWRDAEHVCALADGERHLGHAVLTDRWHAWDATKLNALGDGFKYLGCFDTQEEAKAAVTYAVNLQGRGAVFRSGAGFMNGMEQ